MRISASKGPTGMNSVSLSVFQNDFLPLNDDFLPPDLETTLDEC